MRCKYCYQGGHQHRATCPVLAWNQLVAFREYAQGKEDGKEGRRPSRLSNPYYMLGWNEGDAILSDLLDDGRYCDGGRYDH